MNRNIKMALPMEDVKRWLEAVGQTTTTDNEDQRNLYAKLIVEEFGEFMAAFVDKDDVEQLDACADMIWVIIGYALSRGWDIEGAWTEVTRSNFSKFDPDTGLPIKNPETGKIMKPETFSEPQLERFTH
jgi:NTP pyrophosphatase (non-canonical NTP hydrolase)